jgi:hypothetical protein
VRFNRSEVSRIIILRPACARNGLCQDSMNFVQKAAGLYALRK